ncbi:Rhodanese-like protein [Pyrenochaeta sp. DS3sAY3a]|nr:Rhodanese-like protein [Pyrenochaeta sp. DS3sAY3a]
MSHLTLAHLPYISRETLASQITSSPTQTLPSSTAIIDVRDSDHIGGHIRGSTWVPSSTLDYKIPELVRSLKGKEVVVFHCALSQQRGPGAALRYLRERERVVVEVGTKEGSKEGSGTGEETGEAEGKAREEKEKKQRVYVLRGGFTEWQEKYGGDERLTEGWQKDLWEFGYQG